MKKKRSFVWKALVGTIFLFLADQLIKTAAIHSLKGRAAVPLWPGVLELLYVENRGAAFGILQQQRFFFLVLTAAVMAGILWFYLFRIPDSKRFLPLNVISVFLFSGAAGNFVDRLFRGYVVDLFYFKPINFPVFNLADCYISVSAVCLILLLLFYYREDDFKS